MDVNQIFKDLGMLVHEQGEIVGLYFVFHPQPKLVSTLATMIDN